MTFKLNVGSESILCFCLFWFRFMDFFPIVKAIYGKIPDITADEIKDMQRAFAKEKKMKDLPSKSQILNAYFKAVKE